MESTEEKHPHIDRLAAVLVLLFATTFIAGAVGWLIPIIAPGLSDSVAYAGLTVQIKSLAIVFWFFSFIVYLGCGVWLFHQAARHGRSRWLWFSLGVLGGGVLAVLLWYVVSIHSILADARKYESENT